MGLIIGRVESVMSRRTGPLKTSPSCRDERCCDHRLFRVTLAIAPKFALGNSSLLFPILATFRPPVFLHHKCMQNAYLDCEFLQNLAVAAARSKIWLRAALGGGVRRLCLAYFRVLPGVVKLW